MLLMQAPKRSPAAKSGSSRRAALTVVNTSGSDVAPASSTTPIQRRPSPERSAISSPSRESFVPATRMTAALAKNTSHAMIISPGAEI